MKKTVFFLGLIFISFSLNAQYFTDSLFIKQITEFLKPVMNTPENEQTVQRFLAYWQADLSEYHSNILDALNNMKDKQITRKYFLLYLDNINLLTEAGKLSILPMWNNVLYAKTSERTTQNTHQWITYLNSLLHNNRISPEKDLGIIIDGDYDFSLKKDGSFNFTITSGANVKLFLGQDTIIIRNTSGTYNTSSHLWQGRGGTIYWDKFKDIGQKAYARINGSYKFSSQNKSFTINNVAFSADYRLLKINNLTGKLILHFSYTPDEQKRNPVFVSAQDQYNIPNLLPNTDFTGKIKVAGKKIILSGEIDFYLKDSVLIKSVSDKFEVTPRQIRAYNTAMQLFLAQNLYIWHPSTNMYLLYDSSLIQRSYPYLAEKALSYTPPRILSFIRTNSMAGRQPFHDDYHKMDIYTAEMIWTFDNKAYFVNTINYLEDTAYFVPYSYYSPDILQDFYDYAGNNYAKLFYQYLRHKHFPDTVKLNAFTNYLIRLKIKTSQTTVLAYWQKMEEKGWMRIHYDEKHRKVYAYSISPRFYHIVKASLRSHFLRDTVKLKKYTDDFDVIKIYSIAKIDTSKIFRAFNNMSTNTLGINASVDIGPKTLKIFYPKPFYISRVRQIKVYADTLVFYKDFNFKFNGTIEAGLLTMQGKDFMYKNDSFKINLGLVNTMSMKFYKPVDSTIINTLITENGDTLYVYRYSYKLNESVSQMHNFTGVLAIDKMNNHSGLLAKEDDGYPTLQTSSNSMIFYPKAPVDSLNFYFKNYPFTLKNLTFITPDKLVMTGLFHSSILADMDSVKLSIQEDNSLGFKKVDTTEGFKIFGAASLVGMMQLNSMGLQARAYLKFLSTYAWGVFNLYPDTLKGTADTLIMYPVDRNTMVAQNYPYEYPNLIATDKTDILLYNNKDSTQTMIIKQIGDKPIDMYPNFLKDEQKGVLDSTIIEVGYNGVKASGVMVFADARISGKDFKMNYDNFLSDSCSFEMRDSAFSQTLFNTNNVSCYLDLNTKVGTFVSNDIENYITFPKNRYIVYSDHFQWMINRGLIDIGGSLDDPKYIVVSSADQRDSLIQLGRYDEKYIRLSGTKLVSMKKKNPVNFQASRTTYAPRNGLLIAYDVPYLEIADAKIYSSQPIVILPGGEIDSLRNARIIAGKYEQKIIDAKVKIKDSKSYSGMGYYIYPEDQRIFFDAITTVDTITYAYADLAENKSIKLNDYFTFLGGPTTSDILLKGNEQFLKFNGYVRINNECEQISPRAFVINSQINPDTVMIPVDIPIQGQMSRLYAAPIVHKIDQTRYRMYNTFLTRIPDNTDRILMTTKGYITYSPAKAYYIIGPKEKLLNPDTTLPMIAFDYKRCLIFADNKIDLQIDYGDVLKYKTFGRYRAYLNDEKNEFYSTVVSLDFPFPSKVFDYIRKDVSNSDSLPFVYFDENKNLSRAILLTTHKASEYQDFKETGVLPKELDGNMVLGDVKLIWDPNRASFRTPADDNRIALLSLDGKDLGVYINGYVEFRYKRNGISRILMYLEIEPGVWYFFWYQYKGKNGTMRVASYNNKAEKYISQLNKKQRTLAKHYTIGTAEEDELRRFLSLYGKKL